MGSSNCSNKTTLKCSNNQHHTIFLTLYIEMIEAFFLEMISNYICIPITFNYPLKACFSNKKYPITIQTHQHKL